MLFQRGGMGAYLPKFDQGDDSMIEYQYIFLIKEFSSDWPSKISIFNDLNQLQDISLDEDYASICGMIEDKMKAALAQINEKGYALPYADDKRKLYKIGVNFDSETRTISE